MARKATKGTATTRRTKGAASKKRPAKKKAAPRKSAAKRAKKTRKKAAAPKKAATKTSKRWSQDVTEHSDAMDLKGGVFKQSDPKKIAASLKRSAERSKRRKAGAYQSASSMLTFYINRAGKTLSKTERTRLERAKIELKRLYHREDA